MTDDRHLGTREPPLGLESLHMIIKESGSLMKPVLQAGLAAGAHSLPAGGTGDILFLLSSGPTYVSTCITSSRCLVLPSLPVEWDSPPGLPKTSTLARLLPATVPSTVG